MKVVVIASAGGEVGSAFRDEDRSVQTDPGFIFVGGVRKGENKRGWRTYYIPSYPVRASLADFLSVFAQI